MTRPMTRSIALFALLVLLAGAVLYTRVLPAAEPRHEAFTQARFEQLQAADALVLVDVAADWCPTCKRQQGVLAAYQDAHPDVALHILRVDFDAQKPWVAHFKAPRQSTLVLFKGDRQVWFSVAETRRARIFDAINAAAAD